MLNSRTKKNLWKWYIEGRASPEKNPRLRHIQLSRLGTDCKAFANSIIAKFVSRYTPLALSLTDFAINFSPLSLGQKLFSCSASKVRPLARTHTGQTCRSWQLRDGPRVFEHTQLCLFGIATQRSFFFFFSSFLSHLSKGMCKVARWILPTKTRTRCWTIAN